MLGIFKRKTARAAEVVAEPPGLQRLRHELAVAEGQLARWQDKRITEGSPEQVILERLQRKVLGLKERVAGFAGTAAH